jgi:hypothetical protein
VSRAESRGEVEPQRRSEALRSCTGQCLSTPACAGLRACHPRPRLKLSRACPRLKLSRACSIGEPELVIPANAGNQSLSSPPPIETFEGMLYRGTRVCHPRERGEPELVIPANAGNQTMSIRRYHRIPACAGMTSVCALPACAGMTSVCACEERLVVSMLGSKLRLIG